jgi:hypothetical protein
MGAGAAFQNPAAALGPPARMNAAGPDPGVVSPFRPAHLPADLVSVGRGGMLVLAFDGTVYDDPRNPFGVDLIVYGNPLCMDLAYPGGMAGPIFTEGGTIEVSADGVVWRMVPGEADGGLPTLAFLDAGPYDLQAGRVPTDPARPVDPGVTGPAILGMDYPTLVAAYEGGAGGTGVDIGALGLPWIRYVRIRNASNALAVPEVDAVVAVRPAAHPADLNGDGRVDGADLGILLASWGQPGIADLDFNGIVNGGDLGALLGNWTP